jgi:hypothetical protein
LCLERRAVQPIIRQTAPRVEPLHKAVYVAKRGDQHRGHHVGLFSGELVAVHRRGSLHGWDHFRVDQRGDAGNSGNIATLRYRPGVVLIGLRSLLADGKSSRQRKAPTNAGASLVTCKRAACCLQTRTGLLLAEYNL